MTTKEVVTIDSRVFCEAVHGIIDESCSHDHGDDDIVDLWRDLVEGIGEQLEEVIDGGCDHSVGICHCSQIATMVELKLAMEGKVACPSCGGDGFTFDPLTDEGEDVICPTCDGSGSVGRGERK